MADSDEERGGVPPVREENAEADRETRQAGRAAVEQVLDAVAAALEDQPAMHPGVRAELEAIQIKLTSPKIAGKL